MQLRTAMFVRLLPLLLLTLLSPTSPCAQQETTPPKAAATGGNNKAGAKPAAKPELDAARILEKSEIALRNGDFAEAFCQLRPLARAGNAEAQYNIGWMYHNGYGLRVNDNLALEWWRKASEQGYTEASFSIGMLYNLGEGQISKNLPRAVDYYLMAARAGHDEAIIILRSMLMRDDRAVEGRKHALLETLGERLGPRLQISANRLNIRARPSLQGAVLVRLEKGWPVIELHRQGKWSQVGILRHDDEDTVIGWAWNRYLQKAPKPSPGPSPGQETRPPEAASKDKTGDHVRH